MEIPGFFAAGELISLGKPLFSKVRDERRAKKSPT
jgi:hypothetical protein